MDLHLKPAYNPTFLFTVRTKGIGKIVHIVLVFFLLTVITALYYIFQFSLPLPPGHWIEWFWYIYMFEYHLHVHGILIYLPIIYAALILGWQWTIIVYSVSLIVIMPHIITFSFGISTFLSSITVLLLPVMIAVFITLELNWRAKERQALFERETEREHYIAQIFKVQETERKRIAQELHDGVIQILLVIASRINKLNNNYIKNDADINESEFNWLENTCLSISNELRTLCHELRPSVLDTLGLVSAVRWLIECSYTEIGIKVEYKILGNESELSADLNANVFRIIQEALSNVRRHSEATKVKITLEFTDARLIVYIKDNGKGFIVPGNMNEFTLSGKLGIRGMQERARSMNSSFYINSQPGKGTLIRVILKLGS